MGSFKKLTLDPVDNSTKAGTPKLLDGQYRWLDKDKKVRFELIYRKGEINSYKGFYSTGKIQEEFDYLGLWQGQPHTYQARLYDKEGISKSYYMRPGEYGWMLYGYKNADSVTSVTLKVIGDSTFFTGKMFKNGKVFQEYNEIRIKQSDGKVKEIRHGHVTSWYNNGQKKEEGDYYYGKKTGTWKWWDENGKLIKEGEYKNGDPVIKK